ncbi:RNA polymerase sigma factor [Nocardia takedensis]
MTDDMPTDRATGRGSVGVGSVGVGSVDPGSVEIGSVDTGSVEVGSADPGSVEIGSVDTDSVDVGSVDPGSDVGSVAPGSVDVGAVDPREVALVTAAIDGDADAATEILRGLQDPIYRLALRMTGRPADAEDATQEILLRVFTRLATWRGEAKLLTWAYRIAVNHLLNTRRRSPQEAAQLSLDAFGDLLVQGLTADHRGPEAELLATEVRLQCSQAMLQCLTREERIAFVLDDVFDVGSADAAWILDLTPAAYRKRLERTRKRLRAFLTSTCGHASAQARCRCSRRIAQAVSTGRIDPRRPELSTHPVTGAGRSAAEAEQQMIALHDAAAVLRIHPDYAFPRAKADAVAGLLRSGRFSLLSDASE